MHTFFRSPKAVPRGRFQILLAGESNQRDARITRINMFALSLKGLSPCKGFVQQLVPAYEKLRYLYHIFTFSLPNQTLYSEPFISKSSSLLNISCHACTWRAHTCSLVPLASSTLVPEKGKGSCWSRTWLHINSSSDGGSFPNTASEEHRLVADGQKRSLHGAAFHSACWPQHAAAQCPFQATNTKPHKAGIPPPPDPCIHLFLQTPLPQCWGALWQPWTGREVSFTEWGGVTSDYTWLGFSLELHQGEVWKSLPKHLDWVILLLEVSPCLRQMAKPVSSLQVWNNQARTLQTLSRHLTSLSGRCPDCVCQ